MNTVVISNSQKLPLVVVPLDAADNPTTVDGVPQWTVSDGTLGSVAVAADGLSGVFTPTGPLGVVQVKVRADADLSAAGTRFIEDYGDIQIEIGEAVRLSLRAGSPVPK